MGPLAALLLATPIFGLSLSIGGLEPSLPPASRFGFDVPRLSASASAEAEADVARGAQQAAHAAAAVAGPSPSASAAQDDEARYERELRQRNDLAKIHRTFGILTWASMGVALLFGGFQYHNLYGEFADRDHNPCVTGQGVIFGSDQCYGIPWAHVISTSTATALYFTTFTLSLLMPDPDHADEGSSAFAERVRWHKILRWVHFIGMLAQIGLGIAIANAGDRANDYGTLQALATVHMGVGLLTYAAVTAAGALMTF